MHVHCPNCNASFELTPQRLPAPKFNTAYQSFGWKFECGNCDTQWWVCLGTQSYGEEYLHDASGAAANLRILDNARTPNYVNVHESLNDIVAPTAQRAMAPYSLQRKPSVYAYSKTSVNGKMQNSYHRTSPFPTHVSPVAHEDYGFSENDARENDVKIDKINTTAPLRLGIEKRPVNKKRHWLRSIMIVMLLAIFGFAFVLIQYPQFVMPYVQGQSIDHVVARAISYYDFCVDKIKSMRSRNDGVHVEPDVQTLEPGIQILP